jgi:hypothetical protein
MNEGQGGCEENQDQSMTLPFSSVTTSVRVPADGILVQEETSAGIQPCSESSNQTRVPGAYRVIAVKITLQRPVPVKFRRARRHSRDDL